MKGLGKNKFLIVLFVFLLVFFCGLSDFPLSIEEPNIVLAEINLSLQYTPFLEINPKFDLCDSCQGKLESIPAPLEQNLVPLEWRSSELKKILSMDVWNTYLYYRDTAVKISQVKQIKHAVNHQALDMVNMRPQTDEKQIVRDMWTKACGGIDIWYPYFKVKEVENKIKKKLSFKIFKCKCTPKFEKNSYMYTCRKSF